MLTYKAEQCSRCHGKGTVRFLHLFERDCPVCNGTGQIHVPQVTHEQGSKPFSVSVLHPETIETLKKNPVLLNCLSPNNRADLLRKYGELRQLRPIGYIESPAEKQRRINEGIAYDKRQREVFAGFIKEMNAQNTNFVKQSNQWANEQFEHFVKQSNQWANEQHQNFVKQNRF